MSKRSALLTVIILLLGALPAAAQSACDLTRLFAPEPAATGDNLAWLREPTPVIIEPALMAGGPGGQTKLGCMVTEDCNELADISCSGSICSGISRDCSPFACQRGSVTCDGNTIQCSQVCPPNCTFLQCRRPCQQSGCFASCIDTCTCECETICN